MKKGQCVVRRHRQALGSKGRRLPPGMQALMTLDYMRKGETYAELGAGFAVSTTTASRYVTETGDLLAARSPGLGTALSKAVKAGSTGVPAPRPPDAEGRGRPGRGYCDGATA